jgi:hypothetical protein
MILAHGDARFKYRLFPCFHLQKTHWRFLKRGEASVILVITASLLKVGWFLGALGSSSILHLSIMPTVR